MADGCILVDSSGDPTVAKPSAAIQMENKISLGARRVWNVLLYNAGGAIGEDEGEGHSISLKELRSYLGYSGENYDWLRDCLRSLLGSYVELNIFDKDHTPGWGAYSLLSRAEIVGGVCNYAYDSKLAQLLGASSMYARIGLNKQNEFSSKHSLALYEVLLDYYDVSRREGETPFQTIAVWRRLFGLSSKQYTRFASFKYEVLRKALDEVNQKTDLDGEVVFQKEGRSVVGLKLKVRAKVGCSPKIIPPKSVRSSPSKTVRSKTIYAPDGSLRHDAAEYVESENVGIGW